MIGDEYNQAQGNVDYGQKSCLALGIVIQYNSYSKKANVQSYLI